MADQFTKARWRPAAILEILNDGISETGYSITAGLIVGACSERTTLSTSLFNCFILYSQSYTHLHLHSIHIHIMQSIMSFFIFYLFKTLKNVLI